MDDEYRFQVLKDIIKKQNKLLIAYNKDSIVYYEMYKLSHERERVLREALKSIMETFYNKWDRQDCIDEWNTTAIKMSQVAEKALEANK